MNIIKHMLGQRSGATVNEGGTKMDLLIFISGTVLFIGSLIYLVVSLLKKTFVTKRFFTLIASGFILMLVGLFMADPEIDPTTESENQESEPVGANSLVTRSYLA